MDKYITYGTINSNGKNLKKAKIKELKYFIREDKTLDLNIQERFPLSNFGDKETYLEVGGAQNLIDLFEKIDAKKLDIIESLENVNYKGISEFDEIVLGFNDGITATGVYDFTYDFFEELFDMGKYAKFCVKNELNYLLKENMDRLSVEFKDKRKQYRLINKEDQWFLRAITSSRYNNYDNNISIYLVLLLLGKLAVKEKIGINVKSAYISDSEMRVFFEQDNYVNCPFPNKIDTLNSLYLVFS